MPRSMVFFVLQTMSFERQIGSSTTGWLQPRRSFVGYKMVKGQADTAEGKQFLNRWFVSVGFVLREGWT